MRVEVRSSAMKILLFGMSCTGKSTIARDLAQAFDLNVLEADDEVRRLNGGTFPQDEETIDRYFEETNPKARAIDGIVYVISWLEKEDILAFHKAGFVLVELRTNFETLKQRKLARDGIGVYDEERSRRNYSLHSELTSNLEVRNQFKVSIDTSDLTSSETFQAVVEALSRS
jgi:shikimate kinase